jgi:putative DNA-invertase from lambdoid prophage Rac
MNSLATYIRVSTDGQDATNQLPSVLAWAESHGYNRERVEIYQENESAWKAGHQRELARLLRELRTGRRHYDYLVVFALDRLTRGGIRAIFPLLDSFEKLGCKVVSIKENWIPESGPLRDIFISMIAWAGNYESERKSQNTKAGLARTIQTGVTRSGKKIECLGRPKGSKDKNGRKRTGYLLRYANKGAPSAMSGTASVGDKTN